MHCPSCEKLLTDEFGALAGVKEVKVDRKTDSAEIFYENAEPDFTEIKKTAEKFGYQASETDSRKPGSSVFQWGKIDWTEWLKAGLILVALFFVYRIFKNLGFLGRFTVQSPSLNASVAFLTGVVASVSTCLAVVGSVIIAFGEKYKSEKEGFYAQTLEPNLKFHFGRLMSFFVLGGLLGVIGGELSISGQFYFVFNVFIALVMGWLGLNILGILPAISAVGIKMPERLTSKWNKLKQSNHRAAPFLLGALSFFLPCGFTQSMQIFAVASGSFWLGGAILLFFALGTLPALLALGTAAAWTRQKNQVFKKVAGMLIVIFSVYTFNSGWAMKDISGSVLSTPDRSEKEETQTEKNSDDENNNSAPTQEEQVVVMKITYDGFEPSTLRLKSGVPVKWIIQGDQVTGCTNQVIVPALKIEKDIAKGDNIVNFTPKEKGTINFSCWMGMVRGKFIVE